MSMATRCPACTTVFRVTPQQLQAHDGKVRCGRCAHVFDGFLALTTLPEAGVSSSSSALPLELPELTEAPASLDVASGEPTQISEAIPEALVTPVEIDTQPDTQPQTGTMPESPTLITSPVLAAPARRGAWVFGSVLLIAGLIAQAAYAYRNELAADNPQLRAPLDQMCAALNCVVGLPQRPYLIKIEAFDMQALDTEHPGLLRMTATLRNHADVDLGYPALDLVLTDANDHLLARRIFLPAEYLPPGKPVHAGIAANAELLVQLDLDTGALGAAGFRPDLRAAPVR